MFLRGFRTKGIRTSCCVASAVPGRAELAGLGERLPEWGARPFLFWVCVCVSGTLFQKFFLQSLGSWWEGANFPRGARGCR